MLHAALIAIVLLVSGCETTGRFIEQGGDKARQIVGGIEPTGVVSDTTERKELMKSARALINSVDAEAINQSVTQMATASAKLLERIEAISPDDLQSSSADLAGSLQAVRSQLEAARIDETLTSVRQLSETADAQLNALDVEKANAVLESLHGVSTQMNEAIADLKDASSRVLKRIDEIGAGVQETLRGVPSGDIAEKVNVSLADVERTSAALPQSAVKLKQILGTIDFASRVAVGVLIVLFLCLSMWMYKMVRSARAC